MTTPFIPTAGAVRVDIQFIQGAQQIHNVIWCTREAAWTQAEREALADAIKTWWDTSAKTYFRGDFGLQMITVVNQDTQNAPSTQLVVSPVIYGGASGTSLPNHTAAVATLRTEFRGRSYRGRMYLGGIPASAINDTITFTTTFIANVLTALAALKTAIEALGAVWAVVSHFTNKLPRASGLKTPISAISMDSYIDSQRRRLGLRGV